MINRKTFKASNLRVVSDAPAPDVPPLTIGDRCMINSGGPKMLVVDVGLDKMLVVDVGLDDVTVSWVRNVDVVEHTFSRACVRRVG